MSYRALDSEKGIATMSARSEWKEIADIKVNNAKYYMPLLFMSNILNSNTNKTITPSFFNLTVTNKTRFGADTYQNPSDFEKSPVVYKAVAHCFCGLITNMTTGTHEVRYTTIIEGSGGPGQSGWDQQTDITYKLNVLP